MYRWFDDTPNLEHCQTKKDRSVVTPVQITINKSGLINVANSSYGRNNEYLFIIKNSLDGNIIYANTQKSPAWASNGRLQLPRSLLKQSLSVELNIAQRKGLVNLKQQGAAVKGAYSQTQNIIALFQAADQSTFMHESAHAYLEDLRKLAEQYPDRFDDTPNLEHRQTYCVYIHYLLH